jgi:hypothetical protein
MWRHIDPPVHGTWDVSLALKMTLRTDYYADAERFEIQGEEGIIQVTRCSDRMLDEPALTLYRGGEVRAFHNLKEILKVARRAGARVFGRPPGENRRVCFAQRRNPRLRMIEVATHIEIEDAPKADKAHA